MRWIRADVSSFVDLRHNCSHRVQKYRGKSRASDEMPRSYLSAPYLKRTWNSLGGLTFGNCASLVLQDHPVVAEDSIAFYEKIS